MYALGIDLGGTTLKAVRVGPDGNTFGTERFPTHDGAVPTFLTSIPEFVRRMEAEHGPARAIGISAPGLAARDSRSIAWMQGRMSAVMGLDWTRHLGRSEPVYVLNDAQAALVGERWLGSAKGRRDVVMLTLGTGVGGAVISGGRLLTGHLGRAGHLGHISLDPDGPLDIVNTPGSLEDAMGNHTVAARSGGRFTTTRDLLAAMGKGDAEAARVWDRSVRALAAGVAGLINAFDPEIVVIGGGVAEAKEALFGPLRGYLDRFEWRPTGAGVPVVHAELGELAGAYGAARFALGHGDPHQDSELT